MTFVDGAKLAVGPQSLPAFDGWPQSVHDFTLREVLAVKTALAARRPLLVRGEPGTGKTQLARAAAVSLGRHFLSQALDAHTEARDLFWTLDAVRRLSEAQIMAAAYSAVGIVSKPADVDAERERLEARLAESRFVQPGVLWWAFDWEGAKKQRLVARGDAERAEAPWLNTATAVGTVILLDEIDKADPVLPNALLEVLSVGRFDGPVGCGSVWMSEPSPWSS